MLDIEILGHVRVVGGDGILGDLPNPRLLVYLLLERGRAVPRDQVAFALWPDSGDAQALTNLRRELHLLRRALPEADRLLRTTRRAIEWTAEGPYRLDVARFEDGIEAAGDRDPGPLAAAVELYRGDLAPGIYDDWVAAHRDRLRNRYRDALERLVSILETRREYRLAGEHAARLVALDQLDEGAYRTQMRLAMLLGDRAAGLRAYHACVAAVRRELDVDPSPETRAAYEQLLAWSGAAGGHAGVPPVPAASSAPSQGLVGRDGELAALLEVADDCRDGLPRLVVVRGEPGIGKTRLIEELRRRWASRGGRALDTRSYAAEGSLAYGPIAAWLRAEPLRASLAQLAPVWLAEIARLVPELLADRPDVPPPPPMTEAWQRQRLFEALARAVAAAPAPLLLVLDDAHWADRDTLEWIHFLLRADPPVPGLVAFGVRVEEERANEALSALLVDLRVTGRVREIALGPLGEAATARLASAVAGRELAPGTESRLYRDTRGHPLFVVEMVRSGLAEPGDPGTTDDAAAAEPVLPPRVQAVIAARLAQLPPDSRHLVEVAATVGRDFSLDVIAEASDLDEAEVAQALDELWQRQIVREQAAGSYDFAHDRIRDVAEASIPPGRRRLLRRRVARAIERVHADDLDPVAAQLAAHYEAAGMLPQAIEFHERAAALEVRLSANADALRHLDRALGLLDRLPHSADRDRRELALRMAQTSPLNATLGYSAPALEATLDRGLQLARLVGDRDRAILALNGLFSVHFVRGSIRRSVELSEEALGVIGDDPRFLSMGLLALGGTVLSLGQVDRSVAAFDAALAAHDPAISRPSTFGLDSSVFAMAWSSHALWLRGRWGAALERADAAVEHARALEHPFLQALAAAYGAIVGQMAGEIAAMLELSGEAMGLCRRYGFPYYGEWGEILEAWAARHERRDSADRIDAALATLGSIGAESRRPYYLTLLADVHVAAGRHDAARAVLDAAVASGSAHEDRWWLPEVFRAIGELEPGRDGEAFLDRGLADACDQRSYSLAARVGASLVERRPDRVEEVRNRVAAVAGGLEDDAAAAPLIAAATRAGGRVAAGER